MGEWCQKPPSSIRELRMGLRMKKLTSSCAVMLVWEMMSTEPPESSQWLYYNIFVVLLQEFFFGGGVYGKWLGLVDTDHLGKIDCSFHVLRLILFPNGFPQITFSSWHIFTEWKYHFQETPKASYFRINEASLWEQKATEDTGKPHGPC